MYNSMLNFHHFVGNRMFTVLLVLAVGGFLFLPTGAYADKGLVKKSPQVEHSLGVVNINRDSMKDLENLKGIGEKKAAEIVRYRNKNGNFTSIEQLAEVKGINKAIIEKNRKNISL